MLLSFRSCLGKRIAFLAGAGFLGMFLMGCGAGPMAKPTATAPFKIKGNVHGGAYPIQGATVRLMETQSNAEWDPSTNSYRGNALQLAQTTSDGNGYFSLPDTGWICDAGQYAYVTVTGGHTATQNNNEVVQVATIGGCSTELATQAEIDNVNIYISELSTVAAAYALGNFISLDNTNAPSGQQIVNITAPDANNNAAPGCTGSGNQGFDALYCAHAGLAHAFANAYNLVDQVTYRANQFPTGTARSTLPNNAQASVPQAMVNTIANILQNCVDSTGGSVGDFSSYVLGNANSTHCGDLFYLTTPPGQNAAPSNTLEAALNMARYPNNNVNALFHLQPRSVFFTPTLTSDRMSDNSQLISFTISIFYRGTGLPNDTGMPYPVDVALDANDNVYVAFSGGSAGNTYGAVDELGPDGTGIFAGPKLQRVQNPASLALDANGYLWLANDLQQDGNVYGIATQSSGGQYGSIRSTLSVPNGYAAGIAIDMANNVWVSRDAASQQSLYRFNAANGYAADLFTSPPQLNARAKRILVDNQQNVLGITSSTDNLGSSTSSSLANVFMLPYASRGAAATLHSTALSATAGFGLAASYTDTAFAPLNGELDTEYGYANGVMVPNGAGSFKAASSTGATYSKPMGVAMDGSGDLFWSDFEKSGQIFWMQPASSDTVAAGTLTSFLPCLPANGQCDSSAATYLRGMAIDSAGAMWYVTNGAIGAVIQTLGLAAPTYPLLAYAQGGAVLE